MREDLLDHKANNRSQKTATHVANGSEDAINLNEAMVMVRVIETIVNSEYIYKNIIIIMFQVVFKFTLLTW